MLRKDLSILLVYFLTSYSYLHSDRVRVARSKTLALSHPPAPSTENRRLRAIERAIRLMMEKRGEKKTK